MSKGGHNRKPTTLKVLQGTARPGRMKNEPRPRPVMPGSPPRWLPGEAKRRWHELAPKLERLGLLTEVDGPAFAMMLLHWSIARRAAEALRRDGLLAEDPDHKVADGQPAQRKHPLLQVLRDHSAAFKGYAAAFGLTPADRGRLDVAAGEPDIDEYEEFLLSRPDRMRVP